MTEWEDIQLVGRPRFKEVHPKATGLNVYEWELSRKPEWEWNDLLKREMSLSTFHPVTVKGATLTLTPPEGELQAYANQIQAWVRNANTKYVTSVVPKLAEKRAAMDRKQSESEDRQRRARAETESLDLGDDDSNK